MISTVNNIVMLVVVGLTAEGILALGLRLPYDAFFGNAGLIPLPVQSGSGFVLAVVIVGLVLGTIVNSLQDTLLRPLRHAGVEGSADWVYRRLLIHQEFKRHTALKNKYGELAVARKFQPDTELRSLAVGLFMATAPKQAFDWATQQHSLSRLTANLAFLVPLAGALVISESQSCCARFVTLVVSGLLMWLLLHVSFDWDLYSYNVVYRHCILRMTQPKLMGAVAKSEDDTSTGDSAGGSDPEEP